MNTDVQVQLTEIADQLDESFGVIDEEKARIARLSESRSIQKRQGIIDGKLSEMRSISQKLRTIAEELGGTPTDDAPPTDDKGTDDAPPSE